MRPHRHHARQPGARGCACNRRPASPPGACSGAGVRAGGARPTSARTDATIRRRCACRAQNRRCRRRRRRRARRRHRDRCRGQAIGPPARPRPATGGAPAGPARSPAPGAATEGPGCASALVRSGVSTPAAAPIAAERAARVAKPSARPRPAAGGVPVDPGRSPAPGVATEGPGWATASNGAPSSHALAGPKMAAHTAASPAAASHAPGTAPPGAAACAAAVAATGGLGVGVAAARRAGAASDPPTGQYAPRAPRRKCPCQTSSHRPKERAHEEAAKYGATARKRIAMSSPRRPYSANCAATPRCKAALYSAKPSSATSSRMHCSSLAKSMPVPPP